MIRRNFLKAAVAAVLSPLAAVGATTQTLPVKADPQLNSFGYFSMLYTNLQVEANEYFSLCLYFEDEGSLKTRMSIAHGSYLRVQQPFKMLDYNRGVLTGAAELVVDKLYMPKAWYNKLSAGHVLSSLRPDPKAIVTLRPLSPDVDPVREVDLQLFAMTNVKMTRYKVSSIGDHGVHLQDVHFTQQPTEEEARKGAAFAVDFAVSKPSGV
jgi:hypothetical protein